MYFVPKITCTAVLLLANSDHVKDGPHHGHQEDGAELVKKQPVGHEVTSLTNDGGEEEEEEDVRSEGGGHLITQEEKTETNE